MGSLCSKSGTHSEGTTVLPRPSRGIPAHDEEARAARARAAEERLKASQNRGTNTSNPKKGKLASQANKPVNLTPEAPQDQRLVWD